MRQADRGGVASTELGGQKGREGQRGSQASREGVCRLGGRKAGRQETCRHAGGPVGRQGSRSYQ